MIPQVDVWLGSVLTGSGNIAGGLPFIEANVPTLRKRAELPMQRFDLASVLAIALREAGRHELADTLFRERLESRRSAGLGSHPYAASDYALIADNLVMQGRMREAEAVLDEAPRFESMRGYGAGADFSASGTATQCPLLESALELIRSKRNLVGRDTA